MKAFVGFVALIVLSVAGYGQSYSCLPNDIKEDTVVSNVTLRSSKGVESIRPVTVRQTLKKIKAKCRHGKLVDRHNKEVRFYQLQGCWGTPPPDHEEILERQRTELFALKKKYTVIEMTCNTTGLPRY